MSEVMAVPKLRFKEFDGDWTTSSLKALCKINQGLQIAIEDRFLEDGNNRYFYITNEFLKEGSKKAYFIENPPKAVICDESDILMTRTGNTGQVVTDVKGAFHNNFFKIDFDRSIINKNFFIEFLKKDTTQHLILKYAGASTIPDLNHSDFYRIVMPITTIEEQTKIASFLSAVDEKISQLTQKHALLSQYKQGMMQKLFSQQISFKADDGSEFGEWEETTIGKITSTISTGATPSTLKEEYWNGNIKWMSSGELNHRHVHDVEKTITELGFKSSSTKILPKHCVLIGLAGQGKTRGTVAINYIELSTNQSIAAIHPNPKVFDYRFIFFNLDMRYQELRALSTGDGGRGGLNLQIIKGVEIHLPCLEEQTKIANFLSSIDQKIEVVAQQIEQAKQWKKGLLQQMFV